MRTSLVIATYNWEEALKLVFLSVLNQSQFPDEILIADDGSTNKTKEIIEYFSGKLPIKHIWHKDNGFQKTKILNKAIAQSNSDYIIQIDGDIILHKDFIKDHITNAKEKQFIHGSRAFLNQKITNLAIKNNTINFRAFQKGIKNKLNTINNKFLSKTISTKNKNLKGTRGCNFSFWKDDFIKANGYNEDMIGWGKEDTELSVRLMNIGIEKYQIKFGCVCYHLHHKIANRDGININNNILEEAIKDEITFCKNGIDKYAKRDQ